MLILSTKLICKRKCSSTVDNVYFATEFLEKIIQDNLWEKCEACNKHHYCHIYRNRNLIVENKTKVYEFINNHFIWLTEYGTRLTIRSMTEQLAYQYLRNYILMLFHSLLMDSLRKEITLVVKVVHIIAL